jgi:hypothetical protein
VPDFLCQLMNWIMASPENKITPSASTLGAPGSGDLMGSLARGRKEKTHLTDPWLLRTGPDASPQAFCWIKEAGQKIALINVKQKHRFLVRDTDPLINGSSSHVIIALRGQMLSHSLEFESQ